MSTRGGVASKTGTPENPLSPHADRNYLRASAPRLARTGRGRHSISCRYGRSEGQREGLGGLGETGQVRFGHRRSRDGVANYLPELRVLQGGADVYRRLSALLPLQRVRRGASAASWGVLCVLLLRRLRLPTEADRKPEPRASAKPLLGRGRARKPSPGPHLGRGSQSTSHLASATARAT